MVNLSLTKLVNLLFLFFILSLTIGQLLRIPIGGSLGAITVSDIILFALLVVSAGIFGIRGSFVLPPASQIIFCFIILLFISFINSIRFFEIGLLSGGLYLLLRFIAYLSLYLVTYNLMTGQQLSFWVNLLILISVLVAILGFIQLIVFPDLTSLAIHGWDPHINRLVSTFLDPNFVGAFLVSGFILSETIWFREKKLYLLIASLLILIAVILTFSRSSYLMLLTSQLLMAVFKSRKFAGIVVLVVISLVMLIPKAQTRIIGAITLDDTARARVVSWQRALTIFSDNPILGVGFNNYRIAQAQYGFFDIVSPFGGHSGAGADSSFLTIASTSGVIGLSLFGLIYARLCWVLFNRRTDPLCLASFVTIVSLIVHSQFVNSLLYPGIMAWLSIVAGLALSNEKY